MTEDRASDLVESLPDAVLVIDSDGVIIQVNAEAERLFGHSREALTGAGHTLVVPSGLASVLGGPSDRPVTAGADLGLRARRADGTEFPVEVRLARSGAGRPTVAVVRDVSHRQRQEAELRDALSLVNATLESTADGILVVSSDGNVAGANSRFVEMWGIPDELMASRDDERVLGYVLDQLLDPAAFVAKVHDLYEHPDDESNDVLEFRDGRTFERYSRPQRMGSEVVGRVWSFRDVTTRLRAQEQTRDALARLSSADARFRSLVESSDDSIASATPDGVITSWNAAAERLSGWHREEIVGRHLKTLVGPDELDWAELVQRLATEDTARSRLETELIHRDGSLVPVSLTVSPIYDGETVVGLSAIMRDVTESRAHQHTLMEAQAAAVAASRAKSDFLATMSHEIRTPMNGVIGLTGLLLKTQLDEVQRRYAAGVRGAGEALLGIIDDILDFSKLEAGKVDLERVGFAPRSLMEEIGVLLAASAADKGLDFRTSCAPDVPASVLGDAGRIRQVLLNLAGNAVKFTPSGRVEVRVAVERYPGARDAARLRFEVEDTGIGIDADTRARLFEPFSQADASTTRRFGGTGLGLAISRRLVDAMGGHLVVTSQPEVGSTFGFVLSLPAAPLSDDETTYARRRQALDELDSLGPNPVSLRSSPASAGSHRVLVAEDNAVNQMVALGLLAELGYDAVIVSHGRLALDALASERFDAVLMDCHMPEMDGYAATQELRRREGSGPRTPVIAMTAGVLDENRDRCLAAGMDDFVAKPVDAGMLRASLERWIGGQDRPANVLDTDRVEALRRLGPSDGLGLLATVVPAFLTSSNDALAAVRTALAAGDAAEVRAHAHRLRGAAGNLGAVGVEAICRELEEHVQRTGETPGQPAVKRLGEALAAAQDALAALLQGPG